MILRTTLTMNFYTFMQHRKMAWSSQACYWM